MGYINWFFMILNIILLVSIHNIWDNPSHWLIFFKMVKTTIQLRISNLRDFAQIHYSWHSVLSLPMSQYFNIFQTWHSLHKVTSFCAVPLQKVVQHFFERNRLISKRLAAVQSYKGGHSFKRNIKLFSKRLTAVQSSFEDVRESMEGGQHYFRMVSFEYSF